MNDKSDFDLSVDLTSETSLQTDALSNLDIDEQSFKLNAKNIIENKQLYHDLQLLKIKLSEKDAQLSNLNYEYTTKIENLEEKLNETVHHNQILTTRLSGVMGIHQEESQRMQEQVKIELSRILMRQKELEENNERFMKNENELKRDLRNIDINDAEYNSLMRKNEDYLTLREFVCIRVYDIVKPLRTQLDDVLKHNKQLDALFKNSQNELVQLKKSYEDEKRKHHTDIIDSQKVYYELADTKALLQQSNFKRDNYDRTKYERDEYERKYTECETNLATLSATLKVLSKERDELSRDLGQFKQEITLLKQDKDYLHRQYIEIQSKYALNESKCEQLSSQLEDMKKSREELYEKYINSKEIYKNEYDTKLSQELEQIRNQTAIELDKLRTNTKEFYERENRALKEARDVALNDKDKSELNLREVTKKNNELMNELRIIQLNSDGKLNELKSELKLKAFELERTNLINEENLTNLRKAFLENEKLVKKIEVIQNEYYALKIQNDKNIAELENELNEKRNRLQNYEKVEREMDDVILQAAESENSEDAEKMLFSYGYGANIVTSAKRRLQQNVHLTRRVLQLEKLNTSLRHELDREREKLKEISDEKHLKNVVQQSKQPQEYLIHSIQSKEVQLKKQKTSIEKLQKQIEELTTERENMIKIQGEMSADIEKLIRHNEELFSIREELENKGMHFNLNSNKPNRPANTTTNVAKPKNKIISDTFDILQYEQPEPLFYTKSKQNVQQPAQRLRKSPELHKKVYTIDKN